jgi:enamine deaminase RidA (YjgF/YER057c/UK114 family)
LYFKLWRLSNWARAPVNGMLEHRKPKRFEYISKTGELAAGDFHDQFKQALANLSAVAKAAGGSLDDIVKVTIYVTDLSNFSIINDLITAQFHQPYPARSVIGIKELPKHAIPRDLSICGF